MSTASALWRRPKSAIFRFTDPAVSFDEYKRAWESKEIGEAILEGLADYLAEFVAEFRKVELPPLEKMGPLAK